MSRDFQASYYMIKYPKKNNILSEGPSTPFPH